MKEHADATVLGSFERVEITKVFRGIAYLENIKFLFNFNAPFV